eukprot:TRINITY_DN21942_c0_g1_i2.p3 TRINITY_DN21942_c0_g1~~TRINITY_DN21942_c0_g1_i2.p3  ORF type:complete len:119 (-),score=32.49 TRINITY_DN21942_c0_g1_i2:69-425(-)
MLVVLVMQICFVLYSICFFFFKQKTAYEMQRGLVGSEMCIRDRSTWKYEGGETAKHKYDNLEFVLADLTQSEHLLESHSFAKILQNELIKTTGFPDRGVKQANFYVLRGVYMLSLIHI